MWWRTDPSAEAASLLDGLWCGALQEVGDISAAAQLNFTFPEQDVLHTPKIALYSSIAACGHQPIARWDSEMYRRKAQECVASAQKATDPHDTISWLTMAESWQRLAEKATGPAIRVAPELIVNPGLGVADCPPINRDFSSTSIQTTATT